MANIRKSVVKKAQGGRKIEPTYKNLRMGVANARREAGQSTRGGYGASSADSALYRYGFSRGLKGEKEYPGEGPVQKMGRWEGQNVGKDKLLPKAKPGPSRLGKKDILPNAKPGGSKKVLLKKGGKVTTAKGGKQMLKRADGSVSQRGLWDNLRSKAAQNKKTGAKPKAPTKAMLTQEKKIKAKGK